MSMNVGHVLPEIAIALGAVAALLTAAFTSRGHQWVTMPVAAAAVIVAAVASVGLAAGTEQQLSFDGAWALDGVTQAAELIILGVTLVTLLLSVEWFRTDPRRGEYPAILLFSAAGAMLLAGAADTMEIVVGVLLSSVSGYTLAAYHRGSPAAVEAGMKYFLVGALSNGILLVGVVILYGLVGTTNLAATAAALGPGSDQVALVAVVVCVTVGLAFKIAAVPGHAWLPDVSQAGPLPSAAFLAVAPKVGGLVALARFLDVLPEDAVAWRPLVALVAAATMLLGNLLALWQDDLRRLLGWSSVSQAGYALVAVVVVGRAEMATPSLVVFLAGYAAANLAAFAVVTELRGRTAISDYRDLAAGRPWLAAALTVSLLSLVGIPPLGGFVGKLAVFTAAIEGGYTWLAVFAVANTVVSLFYYLRVVGPMFFEAGSEVRPDARPAPVLGQWAAWGAGVGTVATVAVGLLAGLLFAALEGAQLLP